MLRFLLGVAVGVALTTMARHAYREREKQRLVDEIAHLHEVANSRDRGCD